jgi:hypothetical protein
MKVVARQTSTKAEVVSGGRSSKGQLFQTLARPEIRGN